MGGGRAFSQRYPDKAEASREYDRSLMLDQMCLRLRGFAKRDPMKRLSFATPSATPPHCVVLDHHLSLLVVESCLYQKKKL